MKIIISLGRGIRIFLLLFLFAQNGFSQTQQLNETDPHSFFWNDESTVDYTELNTLRGLDYSNQEFYVKLYIHVLRRSDGSDGESPEGINRMLQILYDDFDPLGINFVRDRYAEIDYIDNDSFFSQPFDNSSAIFNTNNHADGIDIYVFDDLASGGGGVQDGVGQGTAMLLGGYLYLVSKKYFSPVTRTKFVSQLMGQILYLYNTHFGTNGEPNGCPELVNGSNCQNCGDFICDTPADPNILFNVAVGSISTLCDYSPNLNDNIPEFDANGDPYTPDTSNIMSYTLFSCMEGFTPQQVLRMKNALGFLPHLQATQPQNYVYIRPQTDCYACIGTSNKRYFRIYSSYNLNQLYAINSNNSSTMLINNGSYLSVEVSGLLTSEGKPGNFSIVRSGVGGSPGLIEATQSLWVGLPESIPDQTLTGNSTASSNQAVSYILDNRIKGIEFYQWENPQPSAIVYGGEPLQAEVWQHYAYDRFYMFSVAYAGNQSGLVTVYGLNSCGLGSNGFENVICVVNSDDPEGDTDCDPPAPIYYYPNPSNSLLQIDLSLQDYKVFDVVIYDANQLAVYTGQSENVVKTVDVANLTNNTYYLHIYDNGSLILSAILIVNH